MTWGGGRTGAGSVEAARMWNWEMAISFKNKSVFSLRASQGPLVFPVTRQSACRLSSDSFHRRFNWAKLHYVCKFPSANQCGLDITVCADWGLQAAGHILPTEEGGRAEVWVLYRAAVYPGGRRVQLKWAQGSCWQSTCCGPANRLNAHRTWKVV